MDMPGRNVTPSDPYRYGNNGQEREKETFEGAYSADFWGYDSRLGRRWEQDPIVKPWESPYACFSNNPIYFADPQGLTSSTVTPSKDGDPAFSGSLPEVEISFCITCGTTKDANTLAAAPTSNYQPKSNIKATTTINKTPGRYREGWSQITSYNNLMAASKLNTQNIPRINYLGEPSIQNYVQICQNMVYDGGGSLNIAWKGLSLNSEGEVTLDYKGANISVNVSDMEVTSAGLFGGNISQDGFEYGIYAATKETSTATLGPFIVENNAGVVTGTVQVDYIIKNIQAKVLIGVFGSKVTAVRNFTSTLGAVTTETLGSSTTKGISAGVKGLFNSGVSLDIPIQNK